MHITPAEPTRPHGLANAIQRVQSAIDQRALRSHLAHAEGKTPGANALDRLRLNADRRAVETPLPVEPGDPAGEVEVVGVTRTSQLGAGGLDLLA